MINLRDDLIENARTFVIALKLSSIKFDFSFAVPCISQSATLALAFVRFGLISCQELYYFQFAYFFVSFRYFHFGYDIFFRIFCALNNHQKQQHPITCITNHVPFGAWYWIKWLLNSYKHSTCYMCYMAHGHIDTDAFKYTYTQALSKLACVPDERNHGN